MKKLIILTLGLFIVQTSHSQDITDALRYSQDEIQGTARFRALSGAFGALGGDMSAVSINPAGSAVFTSSHVSLSLANNNIKNETRYFNGSSSARDSNFDLNQTGAAFVFYNRNENSNWKKFSLGVAYDKTNDFDNDWLAVGTSNTSIDRYFLDRTEAGEFEFGVLKLLPGEYIEEAYADIGSNYGYDYQQVFLGYWAGIIDPVNMDNDTNDNNIDYISNTAPATAFNQEYFYASTGYNGKFAFNFATQFKDKLYLGLNLNSHFINYDKTTHFYETNSDPNSLANDVFFENRLSTTGSGFSFQLGAIANITENFRAGLAYNSPTWYRIDEELSQNINSNIADPEINYISTVINVYPSYKLQTPGKFTGSLAYIFGKHGLISFDYSIKDYGNTKYRPTSDTYFSRLNQDISNRLTTASTYRFGGEYRIKQLSLRAGYRLEESPYKEDRNDSNYVGDLDGYSLGLGYNFGKFNIDLSFDHAERDYKNQLYSVGLTNRASINNSNNNVILTVGFSL
ncbi:OmpP1/FadL family transporter [Mangrovimonas spongiae]|uniref:Transporter n=1 Tax=Mangrovimonas spongiae TaxID=2494697 RepID=A0A3R9UUS5_9FLAO|nr:outer membrane protein transport protein [Mangrovimonas spongiae]RSK40597.1 transporter [Mangrovimonas spongiae]